MGEVVATQGPFPVIALSAARQYGAPLGQPRALQHHYDVTPEPIGGNLFDLVQGLDNALWARGGSPLVGGPVQPVTLGRGCYWINDPSGSSLGSYRPTGAVQPVRFHPWHEDVTGLPGLLLDSLARTWPEYRGRSPISWTWEGRPAPYTLDQAAPWTEGEAPVYRACIALQQLLLWRIDREVNPSPRQSRKQVKAWGDLGAATVPEATRIAEQFAATFNEQVLPHATATRPPIRSSRTW